MGERQLAQSIVGEAMTREQRDEILQSADLLKQTIIAVYRSSNGAEEYVLWLALQKLSEMTNSVERCVQ